jgi:hypothetical protein
MGRGHPHATHAPFHEWVRTNEPPCPAGWAAPARRSGEGAGLEAGTKRGGFAARLAHASVSAGNDPPYPKNLPDAQLLREAS